MQNGANYTGFANAPNELIIESWDLQILYSITVEEIFIKTFFFEKIRILSGHMNYVKFLKEFLLKFEPLLRLK